MAHYPYIILGNSNDSLSKYFRVMHEGYGVTDSKSQQIRKTAGGDWDITEGSVKEIHSYIIRVRQSEPVANYGTLANLRTLYALNNPAGTPSNILKFTDNYGTGPQNAMLVGDMTRSILGIEIEGNEAWFYVKVTLYIL